MADDGSKPYGDVEYADPGMQSDGKARYPLSDEEKCRAAWSYINMPKNAAKYSPEDLAKVRSRIKAAGERYGIEFSDDESRSEEVEPVADIMRYERSWALDDIMVRSGGDGRTVEAYAAVFDSPSEIRDQHGHYMEVIHRTAFNRAISHGIERVGVFYHHGMTLHGTPSDLGSVPIGSPVDIRADGRGLRTVTRYNRSQFADSILEAIRNGDIRGYSFRGRIFQSNPSRIPKTRVGAPLTTVTRTELGLAEYGPTPTPAYADAGILAVRSVEALAATLARLDHDSRAELARMLAVPTPQEPEQPSAPADPETHTATPDVGPGTEDSPEVGRSGRKAKLTKILSKVEGLK
jgi:HK97 family phage prohead protease